MSRTADRFFTRAVNPVVTKLLDSRFHGVLSDSVLVLHITGKRSGKLMRVPASYAPRGPYLDVFTPARWAHNLEWGQSIELLLRGTHCRATVRTERNPMAVGKALRRFLRAVPREAIFHGVKIRRGQPDAFGIARAAEELCWIELDVEASEHRAEDHTELELAWMPARSRALRATRELHRRLVREVVPGLLRSVRRGSGPGV